MTGPRHCTPEPKHCMHLLASGPAVLLECSVPRHRQCGKRCMLGHHRLRACPCSHTASVSTVGESTPSTALLQLPRVARVTVLWAPARARCLFSVPWRGTPTPLGVFVWPSQPERREAPRQVCGTAEPRSRGACVRPPLDYVCSQPARAPATNMRDSPPRLRASNGTTYAQPPRGAPSHHSHSLQRGAAPELERAREGSQISSSTQ